MAFTATPASRSNLDLLAYDEAAHDVDGNERKPELDVPAGIQRVLAALFARNGAVIQIRASDRRRVFERLAGIPAQVMAIPSARRDSPVRNARSVFKAPRELERTWSR